MRSEAPGHSYVALGPEEDTGEMKYRVGVRIPDLDSGAGEPGLLGETLVVKNPGQVRQRYLQSALSCCGRSDEDEEEHAPAGELVQYEALLEYGICAPVYRCSGFWEKPENPWSPYDRLFTEEGAQEAAWKWVKGRIQEEAAQVYGLLGFYLDRPLNRLGATGWDFLNGEIDGNLKRDKQP